MIRRKSKILDILGWFASAQVLAPTQAGYISALLTFTISRTQGSSFSCFFCTVDSDPSDTRFSALQGKLEIFGYYFRDQEILSITT